MNQKGFTLVELMATLLIIGVVMAITIPNVTGIFSQNKITTYAEDAKKLKTTTEYLIRSDSSNIKPVTNGDCVAVSLDYINNEEFKPPYEGEYLLTKSFVIMKLENKKYHYFVQLIEKLPDAGGYRGFMLVNVNALDGGGYFNEIDEFTSESGLANLTDYVANLPGLVSHSNISSAGCTTMLKVYT